MVRAAAGVAVILFCLAAAPAVWSRGGHEASSDRQIVTLNVLYPGEESDRMRRFLATDFRQRTARDLGLEIRMTYAPWSQYWNALDLALASGDSPDWYWDGNFSFSAHVAKKEAAPLNDLLDRYGADITRVIPKANFTATTIGGKIYGIPSQNAPSADKFLSILARQDLLDAAGVSHINSIADFLDACTRIKTAFPQITPLAGSVWRAMVRELSGPKDLELTGPTEGLLFVVENKPGYDVSSTFDDRKLIASLNAVNRSLVEKGFVSPQTLTEPQNDVVRFREGTYAFENGSIARPLEESAAVQANAPSASLREYLFSPDKPKYIEMPGNEILFVSATSKHSDKAIEFFDWVWKNRDNYELTLYGVPGKDYVVSGDRLRLINTDMLFYEWMFRNINYMRFPTNVTDQFIADYTNWDRGAAYSKLYGFAFDSSPVKVEAARVDSVWNAKALPLIDGYVPFAGNYDETLADLRAAGLEKVRAEFQRQLEQFRTRGNGVAGASDPAGRAQSP